MSKRRHACFHTWAAQECQSHQPFSCKWTCWHLRCFFFFHAESYTHYYDEQTETMGNESCLRSEMSRDISPGASSLMHHTIRGNEKRTQSHGRPDRCFSADGRTASFIRRSSVGYSVVQGPNWTLSLLTESKNWLWWVNKTLIACLLASSFIRICENADASDADVSDSDLQLHLGCTFSPNFVEWHAIFLTLNQQN